MGRGPVGAPAIIRYVNNSVSEVDSVSGLADDMVLIKTLTADSDSTLSFVDGTSDVVLDSTYPIYLFKFINIHPSGDGVRLQFQGNAAGGSGYNETMTTTSFRAYHNEAGTDTGLEYVAGTDQAQGTGFQDITDYGGGSGGADETASGELWLFNPSSTTYTKHFIARIIETEDNNNAQDVFKAGYCNVTAAIDGVQFGVSAGTLDSGVIKMYGVS